MSTSNLYHYSDKPVIIFEDYYLVVLYKPAGYSVEQHPHYPSCESFLKEHLQIQFPNNKRHFVGIVHRLDVLVGGLLVMAKTMSALKQLNKEFSSGNTVKLYRALLQGTIKPEEGNIQGWIEEDKINKKAIFHLKDQSLGKKASLKYKTLSVSNGGSEVEIQLETGRFHQIRVSFASMNCPIVNDVKYGAQKISEAPSIKLVSFFLGIHHPKTGEYMTHSLISAS